MIVLPLIIAIAAATTMRHSFAVRLIAVAVITLSFSVGLGGLVAPHRLAEEKLGIQQNADWDRGARDTRDVVYLVIPLLVSGFGGVVLLALRPVPQIK
jgi:hypothetical protein